MRRASCACHEFDGVEMWIHDPTTHGRSCLAVAIAVLEGCRGAAIKQQHDEILNLAVGLCQHELCYVSVAAEDWLRDNRHRIADRILDGSEHNYLGMHEHDNQKDYIRPKGLFGALEHDF